MKLRIIFAAALSVTFLFLIVLTAMSAPLQHGFGVKEYDEFHTVLHALQHEALPKGDIATIRARAKELIKLGDGITSLGVPAGTKAEKVEDFKKGLKRFSDSLVKYGTDAESSTDADLKTSYLAVHDSFEELADLLPRKSGE